MTEEYRPQQQQQQQQQLLPPLDSRATASTAGSDAAANGLLLLQQQQQLYGSKRLNIEDALSYLDQVKSQFQKQPNVYNSFLDIMKDFNTQRIDTPGVIERVANLFKGHPVLVEGFNTFLPPGFNIVCSSDPKGPHNIRVITPSGIITANSDDNYSAVHSMVPPVANATPYPAHYNNSNITAGSAIGAVAQDHINRLNASAYSSNSVPPPLPREYNHNYHPYHSSYESNNNGSTEVLVEMDDAIGYVNKIKLRFTNEPHIYKSFLDLLQTYRREQRPIQEVYGQVALLFRDAPDLLADFKRFLPDPDAVEMGPTSGQNLAAGSETLPEVVERAPQKGLSRLPGVATYDGGNTLQASVRPLEQQTEQQGLQRAFQPNQRLYQQTPPPPPPKQLPPLAPQQSPPRPEEYAQLPPYGNFQSPVKGNTTQAFKQEPRVSISSSQPPPPPPPPFLPLHASFDNFGYLSERETLKPEFINQHKLPQHQVLYSNPADDPFGQKQITNNTLDEELTFFDKVRKHINNKTTYNNFLKLLNLYSNGIIDKKMLVDRIESFIGDSVELFSWFKKFVQFNNTPYHIENIEFKKHRLELGLCKGYGSYRQLPKTETYMPCSGRDEMCWEVLNDEWVSHPSWESEESGYIAHRKNQYEENLYRVEDERHIYDFQIENNSRTIQTLEVIAHKIANMTDEEKKKFKLPDGLGHTSKTIYKKNIRFIYGPEKGFKVIDALHETPAIAVPIVLKRLKQKDEEWRKSHREWNDTWRDQVLKLYYKSLDHLGLTFKQTDKKLLTTKQLISELSTVKVESNSKRIIPLAPKPREQLEYNFDDKEVLVDISRLAMTWIRISSYLANDKMKLSDFFNSFLGLFFNLNDDILERLRKLSGSNSNNINDDNNSHHHHQTADIPEEEDLASSASSATATPTSGPPSTLLLLSASASASVSSLGLTPSSTSRSPQKKVSDLPTINPRKRHREPDLLRNVLRRNKKLNTRHKDYGSGGSIGGNSSNSPLKDDMSDALVEDELFDDVARAGETWIQTISKDNSITEPDESIIQYKSAKRPIYNLFCNTTMYVFFRYLRTLYDRLLELKQMNGAMEKEIQNRTASPYAQDLDLMSHQLEDLGINIVGKNCYQQVLDMSVRLIEGTIEHQWFEESLRIEYRNKAFKLFTVDKVVQGLVKHMHNITSDHKSSEIMLLFEQDRTALTTTTRQQIIYRMRVRQLMNLEENMFRIQYNELTNDVLLQFVALGDLTLKDKRNKQEQYDYYLTTYLMSHPSEGVPVDDMNLPFMGSSVLNNESEVSVDGYTDPQLKIDIDRESYKLSFVPGSRDEYTRYTVYNNPIHEKIGRKTKIAEKHEKRFFEKVLDGEFGWKNGLEDYQISLGLAQFELLVKKKAAVSEAAKAAGPVEKTVE